MEFSRSGDLLQNNEYQINLKSKIGSGNCASVYDCILIQNNNSQEQLCAKIWDVQQELVQFAKRENDILNIIKQKDNPYLVKIYFSHFYEKQNRLIIIMEKCVESLEQEMKKVQYTPFNVEQIFIQILSGYRVLWENCIVHRDIKPENILIQNNGNMRIYKIADFGTGKICEKMDIVMSKIGTPVYQAPECNPNLFDDQQLQDDFQSLKNSFQKNWKSIVDVYSFGVLAYQLTQGSLPFNPYVQDGITNFLQNLKKQKINIPFNRKLSQANGHLNSLIENSIVYYPSQRINFEKIFSIFFNSPINNPQKIQFPNNFNNKNQGNKADNFQNNQEKLCPPIQGQNFMNNFGNNNFQQQNQTPNNNNFQNQFQNQAPNNINFQNQFQNQGQSNQDQNQPISFINKQFNKPQSQQIVIDTKNDFKIYLNHQINQNCTLYGKPIITWFQQLIKLYENKDSLLMQKNELLEVFLFKQSCTYSLEYLKFYYAMLYSLNSKNFNNYHIQQKFDSESLLIQQILELKKIII